MIRHVPKTVLAAAGAAALAVPLFAMPAGASITPSRISLSDSTPSWASATNDAGPAASSLAVSARVYLTPRGGQAALDAAVKAVSTPGSATYRHFLTVDQYRAQFGPTAAQIASVSAWLTSAGFDLAGVGAGNRYVSVTGGLADVQAAFGTTIHSYRHDGTIEQAPVGDLTIPATVASQVLGVTGLSTDQIVTPDSIVDPTGVAASATTSNPTAKPPPGFVNGRPCSMYFGQIKAKYQADYETKLPEFKGDTLYYATCGYTPNQYRSAYGVDESGLTGKGVTVAITDAYASPTIVSDANTYATRHGDQKFATGQYTEVRPSVPFSHQSQCGPSGWYGEETLDVEAVHGVATDANIRYYASKSCFNNDFRDTLQTVVDENIASYVSNSWGSADSGQTAGATKADTQIFQQGALQGISFLVSSGDNGDEVANTGMMQTDSPASNPNVTAVGGTSDGIGRDGTFVGEAGWGTEKYSLSANGKSWQPIADNPFLYGAGGGYSSLFNRPDYQNGVVPDSAPAGRAVPDIAMDGDPNTGMLIGETQTFPDGEHYGEFRIGGTSLASPLMAGMQALASESVGGRLGFLNPRIYDFARDGGDVYRDVDSSWNAPGVVRADNANGLDPSDGILYSVRTFGDDSSLEAVKGWDDVTGVGTPTVDYLTAPALATTR